MSREAATSSPSRALDPERCRKDFPILDRRVHDGKPLVYLDNAATSQKPRVVIDALSSFYERSNANVHRALHYLGEEATALFEESRGKVARFIGAPGPGQVIFTRGATEGINTVAHTWGRSHVGAGDRILATGMEHHSNLVPWQILCQAVGARLELVPVTADGMLDLKAYEEMLAPDVKLVAVTHVSNVLGTVNPVQDMVRKAHAVGARVLVDAAQSVPHRRVDVREMDADFLVFSSHKMCGPTGVGVLYGRRECLEEMPPFMGGGEMIERVYDDHSTWAPLPYKFEAGTPNIAGVVALGAAVDYLLALGMDLICEHEWELARYMVEALRAMTGVRVFGAAPERGGAVSFEVADIHPDDLSQYVDQQGIAIRAGHLCAQPLMRRLGVPAVARASVYLYNTRDDIDRLVEALHGAQRFFSHV